jgi:hypothetical protein
MMDRRWVLFAGAAVAGMAIAACGDDVEGDADDSAGADSGAPAAQATALPGQGGPALAAAGARKIVFTAHMRLEAEDVAAAFDAAARVATRSGGFVEGSSFDRGDGAEPAAVLTLRVPADSCQAALEDLRAIAGASVLEESAESTEVTEEYTDLASRLRNLEQTEGRYLELMARASNVDDILTLSDRLDQVRGEIERVQGRINLLDELTGMATIEVTLTTAVPAKVEEPGGGGPLEALESAFAWSLDAWRWLATAGLVLGVVALFFGVPGALGVAGFIYLRRRVVTRI